MLLVEGSQTLDLVWVYLTAYHDSRENLWKNSDSSIGIKD